MNGDDFTYAKGYRSSDSEIEHIDLPIEEIMNAVERVAEKNKHFQGTLVREEKLLIIKTIHFSKVLKRVMRVSFIPDENKDGATVMCATMNDLNNPPATGLSKILIKETLKELGLEEQAEKFSKKSSKKELKSFGKRIANEVLSIVKLAIVAVIVLVIIGLIKSLF